MNPLCLVCHERDRNHGQAICEPCDKRIPARFRRPLETYYPWRGQYSTEFAEVLATVRQWSLLNP